MGSVLGAAPAAVLTVAVSQVAAAAAPGTGNLTRLGVAAASAAAWSWLDTAFRTLDLMTTVRGGCAPGATVLTGDTRSIRTLPVAPGTVTSLTGTMRAPGGMLLRPPGRTATVLPAMLTVVTTGPGPALDTATLTALAAAAGWALAGGGGGWSAWLVAALLLA